MKKQVFDVDSFYISLTGTGWSTLNRECYRTLIPNGSIPRDDSFQPYCAMRDGGGSYCAC